ncbi:MAG: hypothetical protein IJO06_03050 [Thermoguttaceae bacterium]|nr:hypothetical protein [Thermoguttaceae bacterium]
MIGRERRRPFENFDSLYPILARWEAERANLLPILSRIRGAPCDFDDFVYT